MIFLKSPSLAVSGPEINKLGLSLSPASSLPVNVSLDCRRNLDHKHTVSRRVSEAYWVWCVLIIRARRASWDCRIGRVGWRLYRKAHGALSRNREKPETGAGGSGTQEPPTWSLGSTGTEKPSRIASWLLQHCMSHQPFRIWKGHCQPSPEL